MSPLAIKALNDAWRELMPVPVLPPREKKQVRPIDDNTHVQEFTVAHLLAAYPPSVALDGRM